MNVGGVAVMTHKVRILFNVGAVETVEFGQRGRGGVAGAVISRGGGEHGRNEL
jgi:hypothetical protein